jgi:GNAT superfamily N-acetyltransferase
MVDLQLEARRALTDQRGGPEWMSENLELQARPESIGERTTVALIDDVVVGTCHTVLGAPSGVALVDWIYVTPEARELGLGEEMLNDAIEAATAAGATRIESCALPGDRETKNMFERFGMKARLLIVGMPLSERPQPPPET